MNTLQNILYFLENFNALIKYHIKAYKEGLPNERKINLNFENIPDIESVREDVLEILRTGDHSSDFVHLINRLYLLSESNSDLIVEGNQQIKQFANELQKKYPFFNTLDRFSLDIFQLIHFDIWNAEDEYSRHIHYKGFDDNLFPQLIEIQFRSDNVILWQTYYLLYNITEAYVLQEKQDIEHQLSFKPEADKEKFIQQQKEARAREIIDLSNGLCDKNVPFLYTRNNPMIKQNGLFYILLSEVMNKISEEEYTKYVELDYTKYRHKHFQWNFASTKLESYIELNNLFGFCNLVRILTNTLLIKDYTEEQKIEPVEILEPEENKEELEEYLDRRDEELDEELDEEIARRNKAAKPKYILPIPILDLIYQEFNNELWDEITLMEFLGMFTTEINRQDYFKLKSKQTTRFYYLLKKIWINSSNTSLFNTEKEWAIPFLQNYKLSYSAYTNQSIRNEGGLKHRNFMKSVDKIL
ncbi:MAG: hypothetical protein LBE13_17510, partial [Bacteroidales bacterium]|nr:hypothetical protein [Bacteroidales bacterium]